MSAPMANVRVKLLFPNPTENCWFLINTEADHIIGDVERRVLGRFGGGDVSAGLFLDGCRLPTEESSLVLRDNDNINVRFTESGPDSVAIHQKEPFVRSPSLDLPKSHKKKHKSEHKKKRHQSEENKEPEHKENEYTKKRQHSEENEEDNEQKKKKKKKHHSNAANQESEPVEVSPKQDKAMEVQQSGNEKEATEVRKESNENNPEENAEASKAKRKRRSRRKRKTSTKTAIVVTELCTTPFATVTKPKLTVTYSSNWLPTNRKQDDKKHMFFDSDQETREAIIKPTEEANPTKPFQPEPSAIQQRLNAVAMGVVSLTAQSDSIQTIPSTSIHQDTQRSELTETVMEIKVLNGEDVPKDDTENLGILPEDSKGYTVVPPPGDYRPKYQQNRSSRRNNNSPASLLQGAQVFNRRRCKKNAFHPLSKEEQLNSMLTNKSTVFQNAIEDNQNGNVEKPQEPKEPPKDYSSMQQLHGLPRENDRIAFKKLELSEDCTPEMSDFQEAVVLRYDPVTKMVDLEMFPTKGERKPSRFDLVVEDETEILTNVADANLKTLSWSSLVDVRLVPST